MGKTAVFGPGHPDFDNQLDLFSMPESSNDGAGPPTEKIESAPCPRCAGSSDRTIPAVAPSEPDLQSSPAKECDLCQGTSTITIRLTLVEGYWWDKASEVVITASSYGKACEKLKLSEYPLLETNFDDRLEPYYVPHGGYAPGR